jgi:transposase
VDGSHIRALSGGPLTGRSPVDRARTGSKHHLIVDRHGVPLAATLTGGHRNDVTQLLPLVDGIGAIAGKRGRPRQRPDRLIADRGYDHDKYRRELRRSGVKPRIARRRTEHGSGLGRVRWVVERTFAWLHNFRRLRIRCERDAALHYALLRLGCSLICWLAHPTMTLERGPLHGCIELGSAGGTAALPQMQKRGETRSARRGERRGRAGRALRRTPGPRPVRARRGPVLGRSHLGGSEWRERKSGCRRFQWMPAWPVPRFWRNAGSWPLQMPVPPWLRCRHFHRASDPAQGSAGACRRRAVSAAT